MQTDEERRWFSRLFLKLVKIKLIEVRLKWFDDSTFLITFLLIQFGCIHGKNSCLYFRYIDQTSRSETMRTNHQQQDSFCTDCDSWLNRLVWKCYWMTAWLFWESAAIHLSTLLLADLWCVHHFKSAHQVLSITIPQNSATNSTQLEGTAAVSLLYFY